MDADRDRRPGFHRRLDHLAQHDLAGVGARAAAGLDDHRCGGLLRRRHDREQLFHVVDVERRHTVLMLGGMIQQLAQADESHDRVLFGSCYRIQLARRPRSNSCRIIGVRMSCMARSSLLPGMTIEFARDMKLPCSMETRYEKLMPRGLLKRITTIDSSAVGIQRATNGFGVSTIGTRWKLTSVSVNCGQM